MRCAMALSVFLRSIFFATCLSCRTLDLGRDGLLRGSVPLGLVGEVLPDRLGELVGLLLVGLGIVPLAVVPRSERVAGVVEIDLERREECLAVAVLAEDQGDALDLLALDLLEALRTPFDDRGETGLLPGVAGLESLEIELGLAELLPEVAMLLATIARGATDLADLFGVDLLRDLHRGPSGVRNELNLAHGVRRPAAEHRIGAGRHDGYLDVVSRYDVQSCRYSNV